MQVSVEGKRVLITAGASGIGLAAAFLEAGACVHVCDVDQSALVAINQTGIEASHADVSSSSEIDAFFPRSKRSGRP